MDYSQEFQTRRTNGELRYFSTLKESLQDAEDKEVWKVSFGLSSGESVRLVRDGEVFFLSQMTDVLEQARSDIRNGRG